MFLLSGWNKDSLIGQLLRFGVFLDNVEQILHIVLVSPLLTLNKQKPAGLLFHIYL